METPSLPAESSFRGWKIVIPLFLLPLLIVVGSVGVFYLFGKLAQHERTPEEHLTEMMSTTSHKRWQSALELSRAVIQRSPGTLDPAFEGKLIAVYESSGAAERELRTYLTLALANVGREKSAALFEGVAGKTGDAPEKIYALWALGKIGLPSSAPTVRAALSADDAGLRKTAAFALGFVGAPSDVPALRALLKDETKDVRWNAALALANLGSDAGHQELLLLLDPVALAAETPGLRDDERAEITISALNAALKLRLSGANDKIQALTASPQPRVRNLAQKALETLGPKL